MLYIEIQLQFIHTLLLRIQTEQAQFCNIYWIYFYYAIVNGSIKQEKTTTLHSKFWYIFACLTSDLVISLCKIFRLLYLHSFLALSRTLLIFFIIFPNTYSFFALTARLCCNDSSKSLSFSSLSICFTYSLLTQSNFRGSLKLCWN